MGKAILAFVGTWVVLSGAYYMGYRTGVHEGFDKARDSILCVGIATTGGMDDAAEKYCDELGVKAHDSFAKSLTPTPSRADNWTIEGEGL